jgi:hypothetical protein
MRVQHRRFWRGFEDTLSLEDDMRTDPGAPFLAVSNGASFCIDRVNLRRVSEPRKRKG